MSGLRLFPIFVGLFFGFFIGLSIYNIIKSKEISAKIGFSFTAIIYIILAAFLIWFGCSELKDTKCPECHYQFDIENYGTYNYCPTCGYQLKNLCSTCGKDLGEEDVNVCPYCGKHQTNNDVKQVAEESK